MKLGLSLVMHYPIQLLMGATTCAKNWALNIIF